MAALPLPFGPPILRVVRPYLRVLPLIVALGLAAAALEGLGIGLVIPLLNIMVEPDTPARSGLPRLLTGFGADLDPRSRILLIAGAILSLMLLKNLVSFANGMLSAAVYGRASHAIRDALAARLTDVAYPFYIRESPGRLLNIISTESWRASDAIATALTVLIHASAALILLLFLCFLSWQLTAAVALGLALVQLLQALVSRGLKSLSGEVARNNGRLASRMLHLVDGARLIRAFGEEAGERRRFSGVSDAVRGLLFRLESRKALIPPAMEVLHGVLFMSIIVGAWLAGVNFAVVAAFVVLLYRMQPHVRGVQGAASQLQALSGSIQEVEWLLDEARHGQAPRGARPAFPVATAVRFDDVHFRFPRGAPVLRGASFAIEMGCATALVGHSGAGKSTIVNLLYRLFEPERGEIFVDDAPLSEIDPAGWRRRLGLASADLDLIEGTVAENIAFGSPGAGSDAIERAAVTADAHDFISRLPQGYDTFLGYRGVNLSAGQRQRIGLARALLRDPEILVLDEATNALDGLSEASIIKTLRARSGRRTTLVISHHRKTLAFCDRVVLLKDGRVLRSAAYAELPAGEIETWYAGDPHAQSIDASPGGAST
ncbi:ABC transporter ATP-binding protein/permease [Phenylobacterium sp. J426]|uniref:ABC transporter ATP-binding protein n=1 Tax=Phenylobacterium sp. J426 TaxID=2898439 RepID=UPI002151C6F2|nr:ABC transporter ATP-binding protein [Phenylobacterium sp. J426]MCR5876460.1 ABC transporter ATP-binding protein/permease [Phenylobacterium sp. J426]